jgi:hypothetical protein
MKLFNRKPEEPTSEHVAFLTIHNDHLEVAQTIDLSDLNYDNLNALVEFAEDLHDLQYAETVDDMQYTPDDEELEDE